MMIEPLAAPLADLKNARRESCVSINVVPPQEFLTVATKKCWLKKSLRSYVHSPQNSFVYTHQNY